MLATLTVNLQRGESPTCAVCGHKMSSHVVNAQGDAICFGCMNPCNAMVRANEDNKAKLQTQQLVQ